MVSDPKIRLSDDREPWEQQPRESARHHARFLVFRDLGVGRTLTRTAVILNATADKIKLNSLRQVSFSYLWSKRAEAWDVFQAAEERHRLARLRREMIDTHLRLATGLIGKGARRLQDIPVEELSAQDIVRFFDTAAKLQRQALGEPERLALSGPGGDGPVVVEDVSGYSPAQRAERMAELAAEWQRRQAARGEQPEV